MSGSETGETSEKEIKQDPPNRKRLRHRKKLLYEKIMHQMEFYFSDANLTKDRFLTQLIKEDPFVPLDTFLKFNKIRALTQDISDIAKAMKHSTLLELSADRFKVKRVSPIEEYDADARTVYVESIPSTATREWLQQVFAEYGPVAYISLPKYRDSQRIKGFAFIEFTKPNDADTCVAEFTKMGCKLPTGTPPEELTSIKTFGMEPQDVEDKQKPEYEPPKKKSKKKEKKTEKRGNWQLPEDERQTDLKINKTTEDANEEQRSKENSDENVVVASMGHKRKKKRMTPPPRSQDDVALWGLQILSKREWKSLRNKYLNLQRTAPKRHDPPPGLQEPALPGGAGDAALPLVRETQSKVKVSSSERRPPTHIRFEEPTLHD